MSGFDNAKVDAEFFPGGEGETADANSPFPGVVKSNFLCNLGYGDPAQLHSRGPRLTFDEACVLL
jgi:3-hydroxypropanoate dehydrogenase